MLIFEIGKVIGNENRKTSSNQMNTTNNDIISNKLVIFCATFTIIIFLLNFIIIHVHSNLIIALVTITEFRTVRSSSDIAAFIFFHSVETHLQHVVCRISSGEIFIQVGSMVGLSDSSFSFPSQTYSHEFSWGGLPVTQFSHKNAT